MKVKTKAILILGAMSFIFLFAYIRSHRYEEKLSKGGKITIGKIDSIIRLPKWSNIYITYYIDNKRYDYHENDLDAEITKNDIGKFYEVRYLQDSPEIIRANYSKQITDTTAILKAGFSREEIENK
jgi:hypothetical protein